MNNIPTSVIYLVGFFSTACAAIAGLYFSSNKILGIWSLFGFLAFGLLAGFLYWHNEIWQEQQTAAIAEKHILPSIEVKRQDGITISATSPSKITSQTIGGRVEHIIDVQNSTDYKFERIGFTIQYPEFIEHPPVVTGPPGFNYKLSAENMDWNVAVSGGGSVSMPKVTKYGSFTLEGTSLLRGQKISLILRSTPDPHHNLRETGKIYFYITGEVFIANGTLEKTQAFTMPFFYDSPNRKISAGKVHLTDHDSDNYVELIRSY